MVEQDTLVQIFGVHGAAIVMLVLWAIKRDKAKVSKDDLKDLKKYMHNRIDQRTPRKEFEARMDAIEGHIAQLQSAQIRADEQNRSDHREIRELLLKLYERQGKE